MSAVIQKQLAALLRDLARQVQALEGTEFDKLLSGELKFEIHVSGNLPAMKREKGKQLSTEELDHLGKDLQQTDTRERARELIDSNLHTRGELCQLARVLDIPVQRSASMENLKVRLVEATVGFRIRSAVIRGTSASVKEPAESVE